MKLKPKAGFTFIELLVTITIIGILAAVIVSRIDGYRASAQTTSLKADLSEMAHAVEVFRGNNDYVLADSNSDCTWLVGAAKGCNTHAIGGVDLGFGTLFTGAANSSQYYPVKLRSTTECYYYFTTDVIVETGGINSYHMPSQFPNYLLVTTTTSNLTQALLSHNFTNVPYWWVMNGVAGNGVQANIPYP